MVTFGQPYDTVRYKKEIHTLNREKGILVSANIIKTWLEIISRKSAIFDIK